MTHVMVHGLYFGPSLINGQHVWWCLCGVVFQSEADFAKHIKTMGGAT